MSRNRNQRQRANCLKKLLHIPQAVARHNMRGAKNLLDSVRPEFERQIISRDPRIQEAYRIACTAVAEHNTKKVA